MLWTPQKGILRVQHNLGGVAAGAPGTTVTTGAASATKGTPAELIASTSFDAYLVTVAAWGYGLTATASDGCLDILIGSATEEMWIPNLLMGYCADAGTRAGPKVWTFPLYVPAGSRISAQAAGLRTTTPVFVGVYLHGGNGYPPFRVGQKVTTYGIGTVPAGTTIAPGASGAEGAWTQLTAATSEDHFAFVPSFQLTNDTASNDRVLAVDLGIGAATEEMIAEGYYFQTNNVEGMGGPFPSLLPAFCDVPAGTRLVMRASNSGTNDAYNGAIHAVS